MKRKYRYITNIKLSLLAKVSLPLKFRREVFTVVVNIINVLHSSVLNYNNPYHMLFHKQPDYYPLLRPYNKHKLTFSSSICLFFLYRVFTHKEYFYLPIYGELYIIQHVILMIQIFFSLRNFFTAKITTQRELINNS